MSYILYGDLRSGAFAAEAALAEADASYEFHRISLKNNEQKAAEFLVINPSGKIPALRLPGGEIVTESAAILLAIADRHPEAGLLPPHASFARAEAYRWIAFMASEIYPMVEIEDYPQRFAPEGSDPEVLRGKAVDRIRERMLTLEAAIAGPWILSAGFSAADIYAAMFFQWTASKEWREANLPKLNALTAALARRPKAGPVWARHYGS